MPDLSHPIPRRLCHRPTTAAFATLAALLLHAPAWTQDASPHAIGITQAPPPGGLLDAVLFYIIAASTVVAVVGVCASRSIVRMAIWLFITLGSVALIYFMLAANFLGAIQLIVYAGGTLVLLIFGVMLTSKSPWTRYPANAVELLAAAVVCLTLLVVLCVFLSDAVWAQTTAIVPGATLADLGRRLIVTYLVPFEAAGVLLMIVMVGAAHMARQEK